MLPTISGEFGVVQEPELRFNDAGKAWLKVRGKAVARKRNDDGTWVDGEICFIDIIVSQKLGENTAESISKGSTITVTGTLHYREWETSEGSKQKTYSIWADSIGVTPRFSPVKATDLPAVTPRQETSEEPPF
jgi:single-strand DNA-binding protein